MDNPRKIDKIKNIFYFGRRIEDAEGLPLPLSEVQGAGIFSFPFAGRAEVSCMRR
jgi:hypothetical protein